MPEVSVEAEKVRASLFATTALSKVSGIPLYKMVLSQQLLLELYERDPTLSVAAAVRQVTDFWTTMEQDPDYVRLSYEQLGVAFQSLLGISLLGVKRFGGGSSAFKDAFAGAIGKLTEQLTKDAAGSFTDPNQRVAEVTTNANLRSRVNGTVREVLERVARRAKEAEGFARAHDELYGVTLGVGAKATAPEILDANPDVAAFEGINSCSARPARSQPI